MFLKFKNNKSPFIQSLFLWFLRLTFPRSSPMMMFFLELGSKVLTLVLVSIISISIYPQMENHDGANVGTGVSTVEYLLVIHWIALVLYEFGQHFSHKSKNILLHLKDPWNFLDILYSVLILLWINLRIK